MGGLLAGTRLAFTAEWGIMDFMGQISLLGPLQQNRLWILLANFLLQVDAELATEDFNV